MEKKKQLIDGSKSHNMTTDPPVKFHYSSNFKQYNICIPRIDRKEMPWNCLSYMTTPNPSLKLNHPNPKKRNHIAPQEQTFTNKNSRQESSLETGKKKGLNLLWRGCNLEIRKGTRGTLASSARAFPRNSGLQRLNTRSSSSLISVSLTAGAMELQPLLPLGTEGDKGKASGRSRLCARKMADFPFQRGTEK